MIERTGPYDKAPPEPPGYARKHPVKHALGTVWAIVLGLLVAALILGVPLLLILRALGGPAI